MSERPKDGADPDATVMLPAGGAKRASDDDATVMMPAPKDDDATIMIPAPRGDDDATVMMPARGGDDDATVMIPAPKGDDDATVMMPARADAEPDPESTIAIPTPGRKRDAAVPALPAAPKAERDPEAVDAAALGGVNPLVAAANPVLSIAAQIRHALRHADPAGLRATLARGVDAFEARARAEGIDDEVASRASLALCALVDESAGSTPWGAGWLEDGFVAARHGTRSADEEVFRILEELRGEPATNRHLLEFYYICLSLGFEGRFRGTPDGRTALEALRAELLEQLRAQRPASDGELSAHWRGVEMQARKPPGALGLWTAAAVTGLFLAGLYIFYGTSLGGLSDPVARDLAQIKVTPPPQKPSAAGAVAVTPRIAEQLAGEIAKGEVAVVGAAGTSTIVIRSDRLFASGSARLEGAVEPVVLRVAEALEQVPGTVVVTGHTDDVPIRTARFPSNWELSTERAASVVRLMSSRLKDPARLRAEGLADSTPAAPNDSTVNRARNRRVEINLRSTP